MVLKPNGIFKALYTEFQQIIKIHESVKKQPELL